MHAKEYKFLWESIAFIHLHEPLSLWCKSDVYHSDLVDLERPQPGGGRKDALFSGRSANYNLLSHTMIP